MFSAPSHYLKEMNRLDTVYLFAPGNSKNKIEKALNSGSDAIIIDLEDAVVSSEKDESRRLVYAVLQEIRPMNPKVYVRINSISTPWFFDDIKMVKMLEGLTGIMIPKCNDKTPITVAGELLGYELEIIPLIESAEGVMNVERILASDKRVKKVAFGSVDFALDIGVDWSEEGLERMYAMSKIVLASRVQGAEPPIDAVFPIIDQEQSFRSDARKGKQIGFFGKMIIHPRHIEWVKEVYTPSPKQMEWSLRVIRTYENGNHSGAIDLEGKLIDRPVYMLAKRLTQSL
jgi:citrate lyase subunit beta/citryl-CoA lyase